MKQLTYLLILLALACQPTEQVRWVEDQAEFDHVVIVLCDDLATHALGCYGNELISTPNIDALANEGMLFEHAYANSPMCTPSRASLLTGKYPHAAGVTLLRTPLPDSVYTLAELCHDHGFNTGIFGKNHFNSSLKHGFDTVVTRRHHRDYLTRSTQLRAPDHVRIRPPWKPFRDHSRTWLNAERASSGNAFHSSEAYFLTSSAVDFIGTHKGEKTFTMLNFHEPHSPFNFSWEFQDTIDPTSIVLPTASVQDSQYIPEVFYDLTDEERRGIVAAYYQSVMYVDACLALLRRNLEEQGILDQTLLIFTSDHGYLLNHHGRFEKHMMWEEAVHVPLIVRGLGSGKNSAPTALVDIFPTVTQALNLPDQEGPGVPLQKSIADPEIEREIFTEYLTDHKYLYRSGDWKYIYSTGIRDLGSGYATGNGPLGVMHRLYNVAIDPRERRNLAEEHPEQLRLLQGKLMERLLQSNPLRTQIDSEMDLEQQLAILAMPPEGENIGSK